MDGLDQKLMMMTLNLILPIENLFAGLIVQQADGLDQRAGDASRADQQEHRLQGRQLVFIMIITSDMSSFRYDAPHKSKPHNFEFSLRAFLDPFSAHHSHHQHHQLHSHDQVCDNDHDAATKHGGGSP